MAFLSLHFSASLGCLLFHTPGLVVPYSENSQIRQTSGHVLVGLLPPVRYVHHVYQVSSIMRTNENKYIEDNKE